MFPPLPYLAEQLKALQQFQKPQGFAPTMDGASPTFDYNRFRLDWILWRSHEASNWGNEPATFSDYYAVWMKSQGPQ